MGNGQSRAAAKKKSLVKLTNLISPVPSDIDVAQAATTVPIKTIAAACGLTESDYEPYGHYKAKVRAPARVYACPCMRRGAPHIRGEDKTHLLARLKNVSVYELWFLGVFFSILSSNVAQNKNKQRARPTQLYPHLPTHPTATTNNTTTTTTTTHVNRFPRRWWRS